MEIPLIIVLFLTTLLWGVVSLIKYMTFLRLRQLLSLSLLQSSTLVVQGCDCYYTSWRVDSLTTY